MSEKHLSDADIQQFVLEKANCSLGIIAHMNQCDVCKKKAEIYKLLFTEIKQVAKPVFDFDLSAAVLSQIVAEKPKFSLNSLPGYSTILFILAAIAILGSLYKTAINLFIRKYILEVVSGISTMIIYLIIATFLVLIIFQCIVMYKKYQRKIEDLNFY
jgi:hypothetical protein